MLSQNQTEDAAETAEIGLYPYQNIKTLVSKKNIDASQGIEEGQIQPASLDLRLGPVAYRVQSSFLPGKTSDVASLLNDFKMHEIDLVNGAVLEKGCVYIVPLLEELNFSAHVSAIANPKSSTGRLDVFCRVITDKASKFDSVNAGYKGPLYIEISPCTFSILARTGDRLSQLRFFHERGRISDDELLNIHEATSLVQGNENEDLADSGVMFSVDLSMENSETVGYRARPHSPVIDLRKIDFYRPQDFWEPVKKSSRHGIILNPGDFYILASRESICIPPGLAAEMVAYDALYGEFRAHYAGFFDPGFGWAEAGGAGSKAVLEVRSHNVPFFLEHAQVVGRLVYEKLIAAPEKTYGMSISSNYQKQQLKLGKHFQTWE